MTLYARKVAMAGAAMGDEKKATEMCRLCSNQTPHKHLDCTSRKFVYSSVSLLQNLVEIWIPNGRNQCPNWSWPSEWNPTASGYEKIEFSSQKSIFLIKVMKCAVSLDASGPTAATDIRNKHSHIFVCEFEWPGVWTSAEIDQALQSRLPRPRVARSNDWGRGRELY